MELTGPKYFTMQEKAVDRVIACIEEKMQDLIESANTDIPLKGLEIITPAYVDEGQKPIEVIVKVAQAYTTIGWSVGASVKLNAFYSFIFRK
jgi:hypothetical protein